MITTGPGTDTDVDNTTASLVVASFRTGATEGAGTAGTLGSGLVGAHGTLTLNSDGSYSYVVNEADGAVQLLNVGGTITDSFNYTVQDPGGLTDTAVLTITIHGADDAPVANNDAGSATEAGGTNNATAGSNATGNVITTGPGTDTDVDNTTASLVVASFRTGATEGAGTAGTLGSGLVGAHGTLTLNSDGSYSYVVNEADGAVQLLNVGGTITDSFNYTVQDPGGLTDTAVLTITIHGADDAPVANNDAGSATEAGGTNNATAGSNATGNVITTGPGTDTDVDNTTASLVVASFRTGATEGAGTAGTLGSGLVGAHGTLTLNSDGSYSYVVNEADGAVQLLNVGGTITDSFNYTVQDPGGLTDTAVLTITIHGADDAPVANNDAGSATEAGGTNNATAGSNATGNVITTGPGTDTDVDNTTASLVVASFRTGATEGAGTAGTLGSGLVGAHGTLTLNSRRQLQLRCQRGRRRGAVAQCRRDHHRQLQLHGSRPRRPDRHGGADHHHPRRRRRAGGEQRRRLCHRGRRHQQRHGRQQRHRQRDHHGPGHRHRRRQHDGIAGGRVVPHRGDGRRRHGRHAGRGLVGAHGTLTLNSDGSYSYVVNEADGAVQLLNVGGTITDSFNYTVQDPGGLTDTAVLTITIHGADDAPVANNDAGSATEAGGTNNATAGSNATGNVITTARHRHRRRQHDGIAGGRVVPHRGDGRRRHGRHARQWAGRRARHAHAQ